MMHKGLDATFVHYGIRKDDMQLIEVLCREAGLDFERLKEFLRAYHDKKLHDPELEDKTVQRLIEDFLSKIQ